MGPEFSYRWSHIDPRICWCFAFFPCKVHSTSTHRQVRCGGMDGFSRVWHELPLSFRLIGISVCNHLVQTPGITPSPAAHLTTGDGQVGLTPTEGQLGGGCMERLCWTGQVIPFRRFLLILIMISHFYIIAFRRHLHPVRGRGSSPEQKNDADDIKMKSNCSNLVMLFE